MGFKDFMKKSLSRDPRLKEMQEQRRMEMMVEEREKSSNQRELERYMKEESEKSIKKNLQEFRELRKREAWSPTKENQILKQPNIFKNHKNILHQDFNLLGGKKLFMKKENNQHKGGNCYFK